MRARGSKAASVTSSPIPRAIWSAYRFTPPTSKIAMARQACWHRCVRSTHGCATFSPMAVYAGAKLRDAMAELGQWSFEIIKRSDTAKGFELLPRRWVVERTFAWLGRCRRLAKDFEATIESAVAWILIAHIRRLTRRLARP
jgi:transposase